MLPLVVPPVLPLLVTSQLIQIGNTVSSGLYTNVTTLAEDAATAPIQAAQQQSSTRGLPILNPMRDLSNGPLRDRQEDPDLLLPNVSEKDY